MSRLEVRGARKTYSTWGRNGAIEALRGVSLSVGSGEIVGLVGPNGAGKSTLLVAIAGGLSLDSGAILLNGREVARGGSRGIAYAPERPAFESTDTALELLVGLAVFRDVSRGEARVMAVKALAEVGLSSDVARRRIRSLSRGMVQRVSLAQALLGEPELVLLDETLSGLDPVLHRHVCRVITALRDRGAAVLLSSHDLTAVEELASRVIVLAEGGVVGTLAAADFAARGALRARFFELLEAPTAEHAQHRDGVAARPNA